MILNPQNIIDIPSPYQDNILQRVRDRQDCSKKFKSLVLFLLAVIPFIDRLTGIGFFTNDVKQPEQNNKYYIIQTVSWLLMLTCGLKLACVFARNLQNQCTIAFMAIFNFSNLYMLIKNGGCLFLWDCRHDEQLQKRYQEFEFKYSIMALFMDDIPCLVYQFLVIRDNGWANPTEIIFICVTFINISLLMFKIFKQCCKRKNQVANSGQVLPAYQENVDPNNESINNFDKINQYYIGDKNPQILPQATKIKQNLQPIKKPVAQLKNTIVNKPKQKSLKKQQQNQLQEKQPSRTEFSPYTPYKKGIYVMNGLQYRATTNNYLSNDIFRVQAHQNQTRGSMTARAAELRGFQRSIGGMGFF